MNRHRAPLDRAAYFPFVGVHLEVMELVPAGTPLTEKPPAASVLAILVAVLRGDGIMALNPPFPRPHHHGPPVTYPLPGLLREFLPVDDLPYVVRLAYGRVAVPHERSEETFHPVHPERRGKAYTAPTECADRITDLVDVHPQAITLIRVFGRLTVTAAVRAVSAASVHVLTSVAVNVGLCMRPPVVVTEYHCPGDRSAAHETVLTPPRYLVLPVVRKIMLAWDRRDPPGGKFCVFFPSLLSSRRAIEAEALSHQLFVVELYLHLEVDGRRVQQRSRVFADLQFDVAVAVQVLRLRDVDVDGAYLVAQGEHLTEFLLHRPHVSSLLFVLLAHVHGADRLRMLVDRQSNNTARGDVVLNEAFIFVVIFIH